MIDIFKLSLIIAIFEHPELCCVTSCANKISNWSPTVFFAALMQLKRHQRLSRDAWLSFTFKNKMIANKELHARKVLSFLFGGQYRITVLRKKN